MGDRACAVCGIPTSKLCAKCSTPYCSRPCQMIDWKTGHKNECGKPVATAPDTVNVDPKPTTQASTAKEVAMISVATASDTVKVDSPKPTTQASTAEEVAMVIASLNLREEFSFRRLIFCKNYSWAIPTPNAIDRLVEFFAGKGMILSVGAGRGLWERILEDRGLRVIATDAFKSHGVETGGRMFTEVFNMDHLTAIDSFPAATTLMLCWPSYNEDFACEALGHFRGDFIIYIGEEEYGCTATCSFFHLLDKEWNLTESIEILNWKGIHDTIKIYERKSTAA